MSNNERFDYFCEQWDELSRNDKISLFKEYCCHSNCDDELFDFEDYFFETFFEGKPMEAARAVFFGNVSNWQDPYIKFNGYGNLDSLNEFQAEELADMYKSEIYDLDKYQDYIDMDEYDYQDEDEEEKL